MVQRLIVASDNTQWHTYTQTLDSIPTDEVSTLDSDLYLPTYNTNKRETPMPPGEIRTPTPTFMPPQTHTLNSAVTRNDVPYYTLEIYATFL